MDSYELQRLLDKTKTHLFIGSNAAFFGSILCSLNFVWNPNIPTACVDGVTVEWNPEWFLSMSEKNREAVLRHEAEHVARMHALRKGERDDKIWNWACDFVINNGLDDEGYDLSGLGGLMDHRFDGLAEEQVYDILRKEHPTPPSDYVPDLGTNPANQKDILPAVVRAVQAVKQAQAGSAPGDVEMYLDTFLNPVIPWEHVLREFFTSMVTDDYTWAKPNRRYPNIYLPSALVDETQLQHLAYYFDTSGSVTTEQLNRFNSEFRYLFDEFKPDKLTLIQFDKKIHTVTEFTQDVDFKGLNIVGRGGTSLVEVRLDILSRKPTAAIIFSDLECRPMDPLPEEIPIIWVVIANPSIRPAFGRVIHIKE